MDVIGRDGYWDKSDLEQMAANEIDVDSILDDANINKDLEDLREVYIFGTKDENGIFKASELNTKDYFLVNTSGKVLDSKGRHKDGSDYYYALTGSGKIAGIYVED